MDAVAVALGSAADEEAVRRIIHQVGLFVISSGDGDDEIASGLSAAKAAFAWERVLQVSTAPADKHSGGLVDASFECFLSETMTPIERLVNGVAGTDTVGRIAFVFCFEWSRESAISTYSGSANELSVYLRLNGGPYRLTCAPPKYSSPNIDLDTPLVWRLSHGGIRSTDERPAVR
jgi:hypothetical protein